MEVFRINGSNEFWSHLVETNRLHVNVQQRYGMLMDLLKSRGVKFEDQRRFLINQAKKCGLYRRTYWDENKKEMGYPKTKSLKAIGWYRELTNYMSWINRNYVTYEVTVSDKAKRDIVVPTKPLTQEQIVEHAAQDRAVASAENKGVKPNRKVTNKEGKDAFLSKVFDNKAILQVILGNLEVLKLYAEQKGASAEFEALVEKLK